MITMLRELDQNRDQEELVLEELSEMALIQAKQEEQAMTILSERSEIMKRREDDSIAIMWEEYLNSIDEGVTSSELDYTSWYFGATEEGADELARLVIEGQKRATASLLWAFEYDEEEIPKEGDYSIITDWNGKAVCIIQTTKVEIIPFNLITEEYAKKEGEGDLSLTHWRRVHKEYFSKECQEIGKEFTSETPVVFEEFEVVYK